ncbi:MAG: hypothetical protein ACYC4D_04550 [Thermoleophilia bacterium]
MKKTYLIMGVAAALSLSLMLVPFVMGAEDDYNRAAANACGSCHAGQGAYGEPGLTEMSTVVNMWRGSSHAWSLEYPDPLRPDRLKSPSCARCHSPLEATVMANGGTVAEGQWQGVTCNVCHPPKAARAGFDPATRIGMYNVATGTWSPVYEENMNDLCTTCHTGSRHGTTFKFGYGKDMWDAGVRCVDCHMANMPTQALNGETLDIASHTWKVEANGCLSCHPDKTVKWAEKEIGKGKIHEGNHVTDPT